MSESKTELLPCPFCGVELVQHKYEHWRVHPNNGCWLSADYVTSRSIVSLGPEKEKWNQRADTLKA